MLIKNTLHYSKHKIAVQVDNSASRTLIPLCDPVIILLLYYYHKVTAMQ